MKLLAIAVVVLASNPAFARDPTWLWCKGSGAIGKPGAIESIAIAASMLEHRGSDGASRDLDVTLFVNASSGEGALLGSKLGTWLGKRVPLKITGVHQPNELAFAGTIVVDADMHVVALTGTFDASPVRADAKGPQLEPFEAKLWCEHLDSFGTTY